MLSPLMWSGRVEGVMDSGRGGNGHATDVVLEAPRALVVAWAWRARASVRVVVFGQ